MSTAGRYRHVVKLGEGTYGSVYKGTEIQTGRVVAFKRMVVTSDDEGIPGAAIREICLLKELRHNNVVELFEVLFEPPKITMIFELCDCDLKRYMESRPQRLLDADTEVRPILKQIFLGLEYLHGRCVVHRDMKPQNIFVNVRGPDFAALTALPSSPPPPPRQLVPNCVNDKSNKPPGSVSPWEEATSARDAPNQLIIKIGDFGLARVEEIPVKKYSQEVVTLWYRSPDVLMSSSLYSYPVDIWSMGAIFFEMSTGKVLFSGRNEDEQLLRMFWLLGSPTKETWPSLLSYTGTTERLERASRAAAERPDLAVGGDVYVQQQQQQAQGSSQSHSSSSRAPDVLTQLAHKRFYHSASAMQRREESARSAANSYHLPVELWFDRPLFNEYMAATPFAASASGAGVDLLRRCLMYEPKHRITAAEAVHHPYLESVPIPTAGALDVLITSLLQTMDAVHLL
ncbi:protein kinase putative (CRK) [Leptomonas pyrrhocoris]|uniref:Protein kinase putative (CRK) n=1 Tax=Leptomonas pyrrhocoris TaxID=157538 RepID=A0A0M9FX57_LEPPY|nr:protein kinase putative (CRK) [Leptomonas pyrrhocoris]KPA77920.1 protein kinase putative (CRK) [Leptomonas pyrrhocoris]|eukprot:XP_015656359.1 protein kinase putative (CRK) [Leptomonas pyrrhocoris]